MDNKQTFLDEDLLFRASKTPESLCQFRLLTLGKLFGSVGLLNTLLPSIIENANSEEKETPEELIQRCEAFQAYVTAQVMMNRMNAEMFRLMSSNVVTQEGQECRTTTIKGFSRCGKTIWIAKNFKPHSIAVVSGITARENLYMKIREFQPSLEFSPFRIMSPESFFQSRENYGDIATVMFDDFSMMNGVTTVGIHQKAMALGATPRTDYIFLG